MYGKDVYLIYCCGTLSHTILLISKESDYTRNPFLKLLFLLLFIIGGPRIFYTVTRYIKCTINNKIIIFLTFL